MPRPCHSGEGRNPGGPRHSGEGRNPAGQGRRIHHSRGDGEGRSPEVSADSRAQGLGNIQPNAPTSKSHQKVRTILRPTKKGAQEEETKKPATPKWP